MITADVARLISKTRIVNKKYAALVLISQNPSPVWEWIENRVRNNHTDLAVPEILIKIDGDAFWTQGKVHLALRDLGFEINESCSSNPANERWFLKW